MTKLIRGNPPRFGIYDHRNAGIDAPSSAEAHLEKSNLIAVELTMAQLALPCPRKRSNDEPRLVASLGSPTLQSVRQGDLPLF